MTRPVEVTTAYCTSVDNLTDAWAFVMSHVDTVGPDPQVHINPIWVGDGRRFEVAVSGMVEQ